jgi:hypothetical protein
MPARTRKKDQRRRDLVSLAEYRLKGWSYAKISAALGISTSQIDYDMREIRRQWRETSARDFDAIMDQERERLDQAAAALWLGWELSVRKNRPDPRFLAGVIQTIKTRMRLFRVGEPEAAGPTKDTEAIEAAIAMLVNEQQRDTEEVKVLELFKNESVQDT